MPGLLLDVPAALLYERGRRGSGTISAGSLDADGETAGAGIDYAGVKLRVGLDGVNKVLELVTEVGDVVRHDQSSGGNQGQDHLQIADVVLLPGVNEHKLERSVKFGNEFERVAAP